MITNRHSVGFLAASMLAGGLLIRDNGLSTAAAPAQTNAVDPAEPPPEKISRQVRRQRERLAAKGRNDAFRPIWLGRSKYMPHIGAKERRRHAA